MELGFDPNVKYLISLGGWTLSGGFSAAAATPESREGLVSSCVRRIITDNNFDGIDLDWEYPARAGAGNPHDASDKLNFSLLVREFKKQLDTLAVENDAYYLLTAAVSAEPYAVSYDVPEISLYFDFINIMTYDFHGSWDARTDHNAPFHNPTTLNWSYVDAINRWLDAGAPANRLVGGHAFYGRSVQGVTDPSNGGLGSSFSAATEGGSHGWEAIYDARDLLDAETTGVVTGSCSSCGGTGFQYYWDDIQQVRV